VESWGCSVIVSFGALLFDSCERVLIEVASWVSCWRILYVEG
jgi:hypothetical protein